MPPREAVCPAHVEARRREPVDEAQRGGGAQAGAGRRHRQRVAAEVERVRLAPARFRAPQVGAPQRAGERVEVGGEFAGDVAAVGVVEARVGEVVERGR